jgi:predicted unusual protein kinase regulating ubiquinone biosynthesis (AarF/ABC1/UbiB family)
VTQVTDHRFFHADPHPGNMGLTPDGRLVLYDFGLAVDVPGDLSEGLKKLLNLLIRRDTKGIVQTLIELGVIIPGTKNIDDIALFFESIIDFLDGRGLTDTGVAEILAREKPFTLPSSFVFLLRTFSLIDIQCKQLDPNFTLYKYLEPMVEVDLTGAYDVQKIVEMPGRIKAINDSVERSRGAMKRSLDRNYELLRVATLINLLALLLQ